MFKTEAGCIVRSSRRSIRLRPFTASAGDKMEVPSSGSVRKLFVSWKSSNSTRTDLCFAYKKCLFCHRSPEKCFLPQSHALALRRASSAIFSSCVRSVVFIKTLPFLLDLFHAGLFKGRWTFFSGLFLSKLALGFCLKFCSRILPSSGIMF